MVGRQDHDDVGLDRSLGRRDDPQPVRLSLCPAARALAQPDAHVDAGVAQVLGVRMSLAAVADHRDLLGRNH